MKDLAQPVLTVPLLPVHEQLGQAQHQALLGCYEEAARQCLAILAVHPDLPDAVGMLGSIRQKQGMSAEAAQLLRQALLTPPLRPEWLNLLAYAEMSLFRLDEALDAIRRAVTLRPKKADYHVTLGRVQLQRLDYNESLAAFWQATVCEPHNAPMHFAMAETLLAMGQFAPGWREYTWIHKVHQAAIGLPNIRVPYWNGMLLPRNRILLLADQGAGDAIQFARYIPMVAARCAEVFVGCQASLVPVLRTVSGVTECFQHRELLDNLAVQARLSDLPGLFGTDADTIPPGVPYVHADPTIRALWRSRLDAVCLGPGLRVGIVWSGNPDHANDQRRSIPLELIEPLHACPGVHLISLQKSPSDAAVPCLPGMIDLTAMIGNFGDTAALISLLDLVITVDTSVAHLAGACGCPVWTMVMTPSDWRWQIGRTDSPWYPTMTLFRQTGQNGWKEVIARVRVALGVFRASGRAA